MQYRGLEKIYPAAAIPEGDGVTVHRTIGRQGLMKLDPFLLLDEMVIPADAKNVGFPEHPHRGFETVTYMLSGSMRHRDTAGNSGEIGPGEAQWMTAGRGIIHSEMPTSKGTEIRGFQLWVNLPGKDKMKAPQYQDIRFSEIPVITGDGYSMRLVSGEFGDHRGPVRGIAVEPFFADVTLTADGAVTLPIPKGHSAFLYPFEGAVTVDGTKLPYRAVGVLSDGDATKIQGTEGSRFLLIAGKPIDEPVARYGPFVMNTREEIMQALDDWNSGNFIAA